MEKLVLIFTTLIRSLLIIFTCVILIPLSIVLMLLLFNREIPLKMARTMWAPAILRISGISLSIENGSNLDPDKSYIFASNHLSYLDIPVIFRAVPVNLHFMAKESLRWVPFVGWYMMATGMIFINRKDRIKSVESLNRAARLIGQGKNVIVFPEGTRSRDSELAGFKKGPFVLASKANAPVVPIYIEGTDGVLKPGSFSIRPRQVRIRIGAPHHVSDYEDITAFMNGVRAGVRELKQAV